MTSPINIFVSYAHEDGHFLQELEKRLSLLRRQGNINIWYDQNTRAGSEWEYEINKHLDSAQIILLLVSPDFLNSNYCYSVEMQQALERHEQGKAQVIPIILRPVYWQSAPFGKLQALPKFGQPITSSKWANLDEAFFEVAEGIRNAIDKTVTMSTIPPHKYKKKFARDMKEISNDVLPAQRAFSTRSIIRMCPRCIEEFYPGDCQIVSQVTKQILMPAPTEWLAKQYARRNPIPLSTPDYVHELACRLCPYCGYFLPYNIETVENITVAVIGDVASGKSHYITSLIHQMQERWIKENKQYVQINCLTKDVEETYITQYLTNVFGRGKQLSATVPAIDYLEPLIYELIFRDLSGGQTKSLILFCMMDLARIMQ